MEQVRKYNSSIRYDNYEDFLQLDGNCSMKLSGKAAKDLCKHAVEHGLLIWRIEGGKTLSKGFQTWADCIWDDTEDYAMDKEEAHKSNLRGLEFIEKMEKSESHFDFFMILVRKYSEAK